MKQLPPPFDIGERIHYLNTPMVCVEYESRTDPETKEPRFWLILHYFAADLTLRTLDLPPNCWEAIKFENDRYKIKPNQ